MEFSGYWSKPGRRGRRAGGAVIVTLALLMVSACGEAGMSTGGGPAGAATDSRQASAQLEQHARKLLGALGGGGSLAVDNAKDVGCKDAFGKPEPLVRAEADFPVHGIDPGRYNELFDAAKSYWKENDWDVGADERPNDLFINATSPDGYLLSLEANKKGMLTISGSSPCVQKGPAGPQR